MVIGALEQCRIQINSLHSANVMYSHLLQGKWYVIFALESKELTLRNVGLHNLYTFL